MYVLASDQGTENVPSVIVGGAAGTGFLPGGESADANMGEGQGVYSLAPSLPHFFLPLCFPLFALNSPQSLPLNTPLSLARLSGVSGLPCSCALSPSICSSFPEMPFLPCPRSSLSSCKALKMLSPAPMHQVFPIHEKCPPCLGSPRSFCSLLWPSLVPVTRLGLYTSHPGFPRSECKFLEGRERWLPYLVFSKLYMGAGWLTKWVHCNMWEGSSSLHLIPDMALLPFMLLANMWTIRASSQGRNKICRLFFF